MPKPMTAKGKQTIRIDIRNEGAPIVVDELLRSAIGVRVCSLFSVGGLSMKVTELPRRGRKGTR